MMRHSRWIGTAVLLSLPLAGCGRGGDAARQAEEERIEEYAKSLGVDADVKLGDNGEVSSVSVEHGLGAVTTTGGSNLKVPDGFPDDVALYPGMNVFSAGDIAGQAQMLQGQAGADANTVEDFYRKEMTAKGWKDTSPGTQSPVMRMLQFTKGSRGASISLLPGNPGTTVQIMLTPG